MRPGVPHGRRRIGPLLSSLLVVTVLFGDARFLILLHVPNDQRLSGEDPLLRRRQAPFQAASVTCRSIVTNSCRRGWCGPSARTPPGRVDRTASSPSACCRGSPWPPAPSPRGGERGIPLATRVSRPDTARDRRSSEWRPGEIVPGRIGVSSGIWLLKRRGRCTSSPSPGSPSPAGGSSLAQKSKSRARKIAIGRALVPVETQKRRHSLQRLADHRVVLLVADLSIEKRRDRGVEGRELGHEVVEGVAPRIFPAWRARPSSSTRCANRHRR